MKIVFVCHDAGLTGAPKVGFEIARILARRYEIVMVVKKDGVLTSMPEYKNVYRKIINSKTSHEIAHTPYSERIETAQKILSAENPDIIYVNSMASADWCEAGKLINKPVILHCHEMKNELKALAGINIFKNDLPSFIDLLITVSPDCERDVIETFSLPFKKIHSTHPGINTTSVLLQSSLNNFTKPKNIYGKELKKSRPLVSMCGTASERKGSDIFLEIAQKLPEFDFLWIGPWDKKEAPGNFAYNKYQSEALPNFFMTNEVKNPYPYLKLTDVFVLTSREDPNPLVVMEALLLSKVCVGFSKTGGSKNLLSRFGVLLHGKVEVEQLVSILKKTITDPVKPLLDEWQLKELRKACDIEDVAKIIIDEVSAISNLN